MFMKDDLRNSSYDERFARSRGLSLRNVGSWTKYPVGRSDLIYGYCSRTKCFGVPYKFGRLVSEGQKQKILNAMKEIESETCIR